MEKVTQIVQIEASDILKRLLEVKGITTSELSKKSGMSRAHINNFKTGKYSNSKMRLSTITILAKILDVPPQLFTKAPYIIEKEE